MVARRHHYLPECYLKGFARPRNHGASHRVHAFDRSGKAFTTNIENIAVERDFNRIEVEGHSPDAFEQGLAKFEGELGPALVRILKSCSLQNHDDRLLLLNLIGLASVRNPFQRENIRGFDERVANILMDLVTATEERWEGQVRKAKAAGYVVPDSEVPYEEVRKAVEDGAFRLEVPREQHIVREMDMLDTVLETLVARKWTTLLTPEKSTGFVTSDHPVCLMFSDPKMRVGLHSPGHGLTGTEIFFPVGKHMAIVGAFEIQDGTVHTLDEKGVAGVNGAIVTYAHQQVYAADPDFTYCRQRGERPRLGASLVKDAHFLKKPGRQRER
jgi:Protein of unknown function (DUF4238)